MTPTKEADVMTIDQERETSGRTVHYEHSRDFADLLRSAECSLCVSTYQAGKLVVLNGTPDALDIRFHNFDRPMGVALRSDCRRMSVAAKDKVWHLTNAAPVLSKAYEIPNRFFLTRGASVTGNIQSHEMAWCDDELWIVNTLFSCLCTLDDKHHFVPRWKPRFISEIAAEDRCHLNGLACWNGKPKYVTAMAQTDHAGGWRAAKERTGCLIDVDSGETVATGFAMPHSPRIHGDAVYLLDSGRGGLVRIDGAGQAQTVARFPGYTRGLAIHGSLAFVGLSRIRETSTFGGVPIAENRNRLKCGVAVVDLKRLELVGQFEFCSGISEIFDVTVVPGVDPLTIHGPFAADDGEQPIWLVPGLRDTQ